MSQKGDQQSSIRLPTTHRSRFRVPSSCKQGLGVIHELVRTHTGKTGRPRREVNRHEEITHETHHRQPSSPAENTGEREDQTGKKGARWIGSCVCIASQAEKASTFVDSFSFPHEDGVRARVTAKAEKQTKKKIPVTPCPAFSIPQRQPTP